MNLQIFVSFLGAYSPPSRNGSLLVTTSSRTYDDRTATTAGTSDFGNVSSPGNVVRVTVGSSSPRRQQAAEEVIRP